MSEGFNIFTNEEWIIKHGKQFLEEYKKKLEELDLKLLNERDKSKYKLKDIRPRIIITEYGPIIFFRRRYIIVGKKGYIYLLDEHLGLKKHSRILPSLKKKVLNYIGTGKRYQDIIDTLGYTNISKTTIGRILNSIDNTSKIFEIENKVNLSIGQNLYINMDDGYIKYRINKKVLKLSVRIVSFNTGVEYKESKSTKTRKRGVLQNKRVFYIIGNKTNPITWKKTIKMINFWANNYYENFANTKLIVGGDGAKWVKKIAREMNAEFHLDRFHGIKYLKDLFVRGKKKYDSSNWDLYKIAVNLFKNGKADQLIKFLKESGLSISKQIMNYFKYNRDGIVSQAEQSYIGVSAETDICNVLKAPLGFKKATYTLRNVVNFLSQRAFEINNNFKFNN
ncbi:Mbov_0401 family ICE element transposase-like protein [Mesoplasma melaleucae]|uniref:Transposase n=1 Tax=Mesoplasma melaleucae TaxID=81459 RepID=A0A2K8NYT2_9MOLU|nr:UPF0236 family protein [Mesoplasma melaleucae]ATZ17803.1 hypothetical protein EMELA_v1c02300 [Mesoplasma melaleucae]